MHPQVEQHHTRATIITTTESKTTMRIIINSYAATTTDELLDGITATLIRDRGSLTETSGTILSFDNSTEVGTYEVTGL